MFPDEALGEKMSEDAGCSVTGTGAAGLLAGAEQDDRGDGEEKDGGGVLHHPSTLYLAAF